jgi:hypothetical protein
MKKITNTIAFVKEYWSILAFFKGAAAGIMWSAMQWHEYQDFKAETVAELEQLRFELRKNTKADQTHSEHIAILGRSYAQLNNMVQTEN